MKSLWEEYMIKGKQIDKAHDYFEKREKAQSRQGVQCS